MLRHIHCTTESKTPIDHDDGRGSVTTILDGHDPSLLPFVHLFATSVYEIEENGCIIVLITRTELVPI